jgi:hypothetical protein
MTMATTYSLDASDASVDLADLQSPVLVAVLGEFETVDTVFAAAEKIRDAGFTRWDVHSPFPIHGIDEAMGIKPTILPWLVLAGGLFGLAGGYVLQWFCNAYIYPFLVSGKPFVSFPVYIPIMFELTILCASLTAVFGMLGLNQLPMLYQPLFKSERFRRVTDDRFFVVIESSDPKFDEVATPKLLAELGATAVENVED